VNTVEYTRLQNDQVVVPDQEAMSAAAIEMDGEKMLGRCKATKSPDMRNHHLYFDTRLNWRRSQSRSNLLLQNGHEVSVAECAVLLFLAAEQLRQCRSSGFFFSRVAEFAWDASE
jgi:hypothetical protein